MAPLVINEYPVNEDTNIPYNPKLSVYIYDNQQDSMNITFETNASTGVWHVLRTYSNVHDGTYTSNTSGMDTPQKYYWWRITVTDSKGETTYKLYKFKTLGGGPAEPPYAPSDPFPINESTNVSVDTDLGWTGGDPNGDPVKYDVYFGTASSPSKIVTNQSALIYNPGTMNYNTKYYWRIVAWDNQSASTKGPLWSFSTGPKLNTPPNTPSNPSPTNGKTKVPLTTKLSWTGGDPDGDPVKYDVYFGTASSPSKVVSNQTALSYNPGTLTSGTTYYWNIVAWDNHSASAKSTTWDSWNFTTTSSSSGGGSNSDGGTTPSEPENIKPIADASAGEPYQGFINSEILFDGSKSYDPDGNITQWLWVFGDNTNGTGEVVQHTYSNAGTYTIYLTVTDNKGVTNTDTTTCIITQPNRPPTEPIITGPTNGTKNTMYTYTALSKDADNDTIQYTFNWGDPISLPQSSGFLPNGSNFTVNHSWVVAGRYEVTVVATDNQSKSSSGITVYIDAVPTGGIGYLLDNNHDGTYDTFYSDASKQITTVQKKNGNYSIDSNGDGKWDYTYNTVNGLTSTYHEQEKTPGFEIVFILGAIALVMFWKRKRKNNT